VLGEGEAVVLRRFVPAYVNVRTRTAMASARTYRRTRSRRYATTIAKRKATSMKADVVCGTPTTSVRRGSDEQERPSASRWVAGPTEGAS
jgi:hypothetical protein